MLDFTADIKAGNELSFEYAYKAYQKKVYAYFFRKTQSAADAEDLLQTAFLKLWQYRGSLNPDYELDRQLFYICRTIFIDHLRKENKKAAIKASLQRKVQEEDTPNISNLDIRAQMEQLLQQMPGIRREVFVLTRMEGYSYKQTAKILSISVKSVDNHLSKALRLMRKDVVFSLILFFLFLLNKK
ncbi:MAG: sigma-70 family RNA polymerase sigma factor [Niabella sp.]|nr:sigma-70 family RNA polymerase sigma factor [Niabella sp.]